MRSVKRVRMEEKTKKGGESMRVFRTMVVLGFVGVVSVHAGDMEEIFETETLFARLYASTQRAMSQEEIQMIFGPQPKKTQKEHCSKKEKNFQKQRNRRPLVRQKPQKGLSTCTRTIIR